jgi:hypothetical protein
MIRTIGGGSGGPELRASSACQLSSDLGAAYTGAGRIGERTADMSIGELRLGKSGNCENEKQ